LKEYFLEIMRQDLTPQDCTKLQQFWDGLNAASVKGPKGWEGGPFCRAIGQQQGFSRFNTIFKLLAGTTFKTFADFVGTDESINTWKGDLLGLDYGIDQIKDKHIQGSDIPSRWLEVLNHMAAGIEVIHHPDVVQAFQNTHTRLTLAFRSMNDHECPAPEDYAARWRRWMDTRLHASANIISGHYRTTVRKNVKPDSLEGEDKRRFELLNSIYSEKHYTLDAPKLPKLVDDKASLSVKILKRRDSLGVCWRSSTATLLPSTSSTADKPSLPPSLTASTSSRSQTGKTSSFVDTITFPQPTPIFSLRPGALSPNCRDGLWGSEKGARASARKGDVPVQTGARGLFVIVSLPCLLQLPHGLRRRRSAREEERGSFPRELSARRLVLRVSASSNGLRGHASAIGGCPQTLDGNICRGWQYGLVSLFLSLSGLGDSNS
jgi:hypothetical protein